MRSGRVLLVAAVAATLAAAIPISRPAPPEPPDFADVKDCSWLKLRHVQAYSTWKGSVRYGVEDPMELEAMRATLRRLQQLGDCGMRG